MRPFTRRSDDWIFGALLAAVLGSGVGLNGAWVREGRVARAAAPASNPASTAPALVGTPAPSQAGITGAPRIAAAAAQLVP